MPAHEITTLPGLHRRLAFVLPLAAWTCYAPLGAKYLSWLLATGLALGVVAHQRAWRQAFLQPAAWPLLALGAWMLLSALWSPAPPDRLLAHAWTYLLPFSALAIALACPPQMALRALQHFVLASALVGGLWWLNGLVEFPPSRLFSSTVQATGNERIASSTLLAFGAALACWLASQAGGLRGRALWLGLATLIAAGIAAQDRRTGMLLLPLVLLLWAFAMPRRPAVKASLVLGLLVAAAAVWSFSDGVRARFAEGQREVQAYSSSQPEVNTSWGLRLRMIERTWAMIEQRPLTGQGLGSWRQLWEARSVPASREIDNSTPHNEYLLAAAQAGLPAALLLLAWFLAMATRAWRAGAPGMPALMLWAGIALVALANSNVRDAKWALPLWVLAGVATALAQSRRNENTERSPREKPAAP